MSAQHFYQSEGQSANSTALQFLTTDACSDYLQQCNAQQKHFFLAASFTGKVGQYCFWMQEEPCFYIGIGDGSEEQLAKAISMVVLHLPEGSYHSTVALPYYAELSWALSQYKFEQYKKTTSKKNILLVSPEAESQLNTEVDAIFLVRDLINMPANVLRPSYLATFMSALAHQYQATFQEWVGTALITHNFPAIYTVGAGSDEPPRLLSLRWGDPSLPKIVLIGKGVCFDSGGLDIKPANYMRFMKKDMGGAAHVLALAQWIMTQHLPISLEVYIPAVENAVSSTAFRPGDVITMRNGLTVEVDNTDAEGRLILADILALVSEEDQKPDLVVDFATLTGAARVALGTEIAVLFSNDKQVAATVMETGETLFDPIHTLPLYAGYESQLESSIADLANCSNTAYGGAITAALFLQRFIHKDIPWLHFDIMAWNERTKPAKPEGGEAMGLRAMAYYLKARFKND